LSKVIILRNLRQFAGFEPIVERLEHRIPITRAHRRYVEYVTNWRTTAPDATPSFELAALEGVGRDADQRSDLFAAAELGQERDQRASQHWSDARHGSEQPVSMGERFGSHNLGQMAVEHVDIGCEPSDPTAGKPLQQSHLPAIWTHSRRRLSQH
jgi:hypothetical protein